MEGFLEIMTIRVLLLKQWFDPEPTSKGLIFARGLIKQGFEVEVLTGFPNYPGGKLYPGYKIKLIQKENIDGVHITRVPLYPSHNSNAIGRILNYVSFAVCSLFYGLFGAKRPDVIYAYHPPLTVGLTAACIRFFRRVPIVYDIQDMWPDTLKSTGMISSGKVLKIVGWACDWVYSRVDQIVVLSPGFKRLLIERGVPEKKIEVIYNWYAEEGLKLECADYPENFPSQNYFTVLFAGNMGKAQALDSILEAADLLKTTESKVRFVFLGDGLEVERLKKLALDKNLYNVVFLPRVSMSEVGQYLSCADALLVHLKKDELFKVTIPSKTQAYMSVGKPILMGVDGDAADLIRQSKSGIVAESENPESLKKALLELKNLTPEQRNEMGRNGKSFYDEKLSLNSGVKKFSKIFRDVVK